MEATGIGPSTENEAGNNLVGSPLFMTRLKDERRPTCLDLSDGIKDEENERKKKSNQRINSKSKGEIKTLKDKATDETGQKQKTSWYRS